jgi:hypothetical protein
MKIQKNNVIWYLKLVLNYSLSIFLKSHVASFLQNRSNVYTRETYIRGNVAGALWPKTGQPKSAKFTYT